MISLGGAGIQNAIVEACLLTNIVPHFSLKFVIGFFQDIIGELEKVLECTLVQFCL